MMTHIVSVIIIRRGRRNRSAVEEEVQLPQSSGRAPTPPFLRNTPSPIAEATVTATTPLPLTAFLPPPAWEVRSPVWTRTYRRYSAPAHQLIFSRASGQALTAKEEVYPPWSVPVLSMTLMVRTQMMITLLVSAAVKVQPSEPDPPRSSSSSIRPPTSSRSLCGIFRHLSLHLT